MRALPRLSRLLDGPHLTLPRPLDRTAECWARLRPRVRCLLALTAVLLVAVGLHLRVRAADARWGGAPIAVLVAEQDLPVGAPVTNLRRAAYPPLAVPDGAAARVHEGAVLALALPRGAVLTEAHLNLRGPAAGLPADLRAVPVPVEDGWAVVAGGWVDVWSLDAGGQPSNLVARSRPVVDVRQDDGGVTALVGLAESEVAKATAGLALGRVLLAHAPPPR